MFNVGGGEFLIIFLVALIVLGPQKLPDAARQIGKIVGEFRRISSGFQREMQSALKDPVSKVTGESTPKSLTDVTKVAEVKAIDDVKQAAPAEAKPAEAASPERKPSFDPSGDKTTSTSAAVSTPSADSDDARTSENAASEDPVSNDGPTEKPDESPEAPMFGDR
jgi:sec-independent protein translocase protein TatB